MEKIQILDLTKSQPNPPPAYGGKHKHRIEGGKVVERKPKDVDSIVLHQTAVEYGPRDNPSAKHARALQVACHALAFADGTVVLPNPLPWYVNHANGFNRHSLGIEIEGAFLGAPGLPIAPGGHKPSPVTPLLVASACAAVEELLERATRWGASIQYVLAHRQSSDTRRADPGWELWQRVALEHCVGRLGLKTRPTMVDDQGRPIPEVWDPSQTGVRY